MINISFDLSHTESDRFYTMTAKGHAKDEEDTDANLKCASATALNAALAQSILDDYNAGRLECKPHIEVAVGEAHIEATPKPEYDYAVYVQFETVMNGYRCLAGNYPKTYTLDCKV